MSVDTSVSIGVGFLVDPDALKRYAERVDPDDDWDEEEYLETLLKGTTGLVQGVGGSYYEDEPMTPWIAVERLTSEYDVDDIPGGVVTYDKPVVTLDERLALNAVAKELGQAEPKLTQFMSVLWH